QVRALSSKQGGFIFSLPALLAAGTAIGSLASGAATIAKTINEKKAIDKQLKEMERHNKELEDSINGPGTHWTCWIKQSENLCYYFDSFGVAPPIEFEKYVKCNILYSTYQIQKMEEVICGHLCLLVLYGAVKLKLDFHSVVLKLFFLYNK
ncbi:unnamed protein product, partial [Rotaria magnacalcarata]